MSLSDSGRMEALQRTGLAAAPDPVFDRIAEMVCSTLNVPVALVSLVDTERQYFPGARGLGEPWGRERQTPLSHSFCQHVVTTAEPLIIVDARTDPRVVGNLAIDDLAVIGYAGMPLTDAAGRVLGSLCAIDHRPRHWTTQELTLLADLAATCSDTLRLRISSRRAERRQDLAEAATERSALLLRASVALSAAGSVAEITGRVRELVTGTLDPAYVGISLLHKGDIALQSDELMPPQVADRWRRYPAGAATPSALAVSTGAIVLLPDRASVGTLAPAAAGTFDEMGWQAAASVPLPGPGGPIGALTFTWKQPYALDPAEQAVLAALAGYVAQNLTRVIALEDRRTAAATLQKALLTPLPQHDHIRLAARYLPAHHEDHVGGDWYDAISLPEGRLALVIGDVTGHSIVAAAAMSQYRSMLRTLLIDRHEPPSALLRRLEQISRTLGRVELTTAVLAYLDPAADGGHTLTWANAGHPPPSLLLPDGRVQLLTGRDPLLGAIRHVSRRSHTCHLPPGAVLVLHTDGLIESRTASFDDGMAGLHTHLARSAGVDPEALADQLIGLNQAGEDDVAILIVATPG